MNKPWIPTISQFVHPEVDKAIKYLYQKFYTSEAELGAATTDIARITAKAITKENLQSTLQASGQHPLNVTDLIGLLAQPQKAMVTNASTSGSVPGAPANGQLQLINGQLFYYNTATQTWVPISAVAVVLFDTHANRLANFAAAKYPPGSLFYETDRKVMYYETGGTTWTYLGGTMEDVIANRPSDLGSNDLNFLFLAADTLLTYFWTGAAWTLVPVNTVGAGSYGDATHTDIIVVDTNGRVTSITPTAITFPGTSGFSGTATVRNSAGTGTSSFVFVNGLCASFTP